MFSRMCEWVKNLREMEGEKGVRGGVRRGGEKGGEKGGGKGDEKEG